MWVYIWVYMYQVYTEDKNDQAGRYHDASALVAVFGRDAGHWHFSVYVLSAGAEKGWAIQIQTFDILAGYG